jgi:hypothetical protein
VRGIAYNRTTMKYITVTIARDPTTGLLSVDRAATKVRASAAVRPGAPKVQRRKAMAAKKAAPKKAAAKRA